MTIQFVADYTKDSPGERASKRPTASIVWSAESFVVHYTEGVTTALEIKKLMETQDAI